MTMTEPSTETEGMLETPFAESPVLSESAPEALSFMAWTETTSPFAETATAGFELEDEQTELMAEAFETLRDEQFDEALAELITETAEAADGRLAGEQPLQFAAERAQLADAHLAPIGFEAEQAVQQFTESIQNLDLEGMTPDQLDEVLDRFEPGLRGVTPAGEEFIGGLIRKAKSVVKSVVNVAGKVAKAALPILGPILNKLKALIRPLLKRVLALAIGRLPRALHEPARALARKLGIGEAEFEMESLELEAEEEDLAQGFAGSPVTAGNPETLSESLDAALAESVLGGEALEQGESFGHDHERGAEPEAGSQLEMLAEARSTFMGQLQGANEGEDLTPALEQFIPAILPALRLGIRLVGRPKVVNFLAGFLAKLIGKWVGPQLSGPLSQAIVDVGMRLVGLEQGQPGELGAEAAPAMLASVVEDTVRRLAEQPEHLFEDEDLLQATVTEAFEQAVGAHFPAQLVRPDLRLAPTLGGSFVTRHPRTPFAYKKYSRVPELELTEPQAKSIRTFGGVSLSAAVRAAGFRLPAKFRVHVYEAGPGTTLPRLAGLERIGGPARSRGAYGQLHPLTTSAAGLLLREPKLGVDAPGRFLKSRHKISVGQRFYYLEPVGHSAVAPSPLSCDASRPSDVRMRGNLARGEARVALFFSESDAQQLAAAASSKAGGATVLRMLLRRLFVARRAVGRTDSSVKVGKESAPVGESEAARRVGRLPIVAQVRLRQQLAASIAPALAELVRNRVQDVVRAAQDPRCGLTVLVHVRGLGGTPAATATVVAGRKRP